MPVPKPWTEVESSEQYNSLSSYDKFAAKKAYWNEISLPAIEEHNSNTFKDRVDPIQVKQEFFGGVLVEDIPEFSNKDAALNVLGQTISETASVIGESAGKLASGLAQPIIHPVNTVKSITGMLVGAAQKLIPGEQPQEFYVNQVAELYKERYGSVDAIAETVATDPFGFISDLYMVAGATAGGLKVAGKISGIKSLSKAGSFPMTSKAISDTGKNIKKTILRTKSPETKVYKAYNKALNPKSKTTKQAIYSKDDVIGRIKTIDESIPEEGLVNNITGETFTSPRNEYELLLANENAKQVVWKEANLLSQGATDSGATINLAKAAKNAVKSTKKDFGDIAIKTTHAKTMEKVLSAADELSAQGDITPTQAQAFLKTMTKEVQKRKAAGGAAVDLDLDTFKTYLYENIVDATDTAIDTSLNKAGYTATRQKYARLKSGEKELLNGANRFKARTAGTGGGVSHPIMNIFSIEAIGNGLATGQAATGFGKAFMLQAAKGAWDWYKNPSRQVSKMFKHIKNVKIDDPIHVFNPEILTDMPINSQIKLPAKSTPLRLEKTTPKGLPNMAKEAITKRPKRIASSASGDVILMDDPIKKLTFEVGQPSSDVFQFGPELTGGTQGLKGGFGSFTIKPGSPLKRRTKPSKNIRQR